MPSMLQALWSVLTCTGKQQGLTDLLLDKSGL